MVVWWHPKSSMLYTTLPYQAKKWYGDDYLDHATVCDNLFDYAEWFIWRGVVR